MLRTEKVLQLRGQQGRAVRVVREHYLRPDVPCRAALCRAALCQAARDGKLLSDDVTHYVVPDCKVVQEYLEILEFPELKGIIFMQTACQAVQHQKGRRQYNKLRNLLKDPRHDCTVFANEFHQHCYLPREKGESMEKWQTRNIYNAAVWYYNHCLGQMPVVMVTEDEDAIRQYGNETEGVFVISFKNYLDNFWPDLKAAHELFDSILQARRERESESQENHGKEYPEHLPLEILEAGIKSGRYLQGTLNVNKHRAQLEAFVRLQGFGSKDTELQSDILIYGPKARNRAIHGDVVVVELLPVQEWKGRTGALCENEAEDKAPADTTGDPMPTGKVVGIIQKNWRDYVVTFPSKEESQSQGRNAQKVLVTPWDYRIPKIRISTQQAEALQEHRVPALTEVSLQEHRVPALTEVSLQEHRVPALTEVSLQEHRVPALTEVSLQEHRVVVRIDSWESTSLYPNGHFVRVLGRIGDLEGEIAAILVENSICAAPFSEIQMSEMPTSSSKSPWKVSPEEEKKRLDLRETHVIFSIDPKGCEDVDDALSVRALPGGSLELGVHIADVTHFVPPNSCTDVEARARATTCYLADRRYDMLPPVLSADLCSLLSGVDRYAVSVLWELDKDSYEVLRVQYRRTIIRSAYKLEYETAQALLDGEPGAGGDIPELSHLDGEARLGKLSELTWAISKLTDIARHFRAQRDRCGALELEGIEIRVQLDEKRNIHDLLPRQPLEVHETVAECMILANHWVAKRIAEAFPHQALLRQHPPPRQEFFAELRECASAKGFSIDTRSNKALAESLDRANDPWDPVVNQLLRSMATHAMANALYFSTGSCPEEQFHHYGLALEKYTHFTSPIRRYADVVVHRLLLAAALRGAEGHGKDSVSSSKDLEELCRHINNRNRAAQRAQKQSTELFQCRYFRDRSAEADERCVADGVIYSIRTNGVLVFVPRYGIKGAAYMKNKEGLVLSCAGAGGCEWQPGSLQRSQSTITSTTATGESLTLSLFDHITVRILVQTSRCHADTIRLEMVRNTPHRSAAAAPRSGPAPRAELLPPPPGPGAEETQRAQQSGTGQVLEEEYQEFRQTAGHSLYQLLEEIRELALLDVSAGGAT